MTKRVIFDASVIVSGNVTGNLYKTGLYRVSFEVLHELVKSTEFELYLFDVFHRERELIKYVQMEFPQCHRIKVHSKLYRLFIFPLGQLVDYLRKTQQLSHLKIIYLITGFLKNIIILIEKLARKIEKMLFSKERIIDALSQCSIYYSTYFPIPEEVRLNPSIKKVYTVHDLIPLIHPEYFSTPYNQQLIKEVVDHIGIKDYIVAVSESTKMDILKYRPDIFPDHIIVAPLAASKAFYKESNIKKIAQICIKYHIPETRYILSVCTLEPRKNLMLLIKAYNELLKQNPGYDLNLVLIGSYGWSSNDLLDKIREINQTYNNPIILTGFVPDCDLSALYSGAYIFVYPSLYEGFGLPLLEAMQCGVPVITSNNTSIPEVVGDCGIMLDPNNEMELVEAINLVSRNKELHGKMAQMSLLRASCFNWIKVSEKVMHVFNLESSTNA